VGPRIHFGAPRLTTPDAERSAPHPEDAPHPEEDSPRLRSPFLILQFFVFPMSIVAVCVLVFLVFGWVASDRKTPRGYLQEVRTGGGMFNIKRWQAAFALASALERDREVARKDPGFVDEVVKLLEETEKEDQTDTPLVRRYLVLTLARLGDPRALPTLRRVVAEAQPESDSLTVIYACVALGTFRDEAAVPDLRRLARSEDAGLRKAAVHGLGSIPTPEAREAAAVALADPVEDVRWNAALGLARAGDTRATPVLLQMMDRSHLAGVPDLSPQQQDEAVLGAVQAAVHLKDPALRPALERLRDGDPNLKVREAARLVLAGPPAGQVGTLTLRPSKVEWPDFRDVRDSGIGEVLDG
jgi:HEAT repeat protein/PBS lyase HEAT-like repeat-containing protein